MLLLIKHYIFCLFHPFRGLNPTYARLKVESAASNWEYTYAKVFFLRPLSITEYLAMTWPLVMVGSFYNLSLFPIARLFSQRLGLNLDEGDFIFSPVYTMVYELTLIAFYPLIGFIYIKLWTLIISFFLDFMEKDYEFRDVELVASNTLVSKSFLLIPVVGPFLAKLMAPFYLYAGLKGRLGLSNGQALVVVLSPIVFLVGLLFIFIFLASVFISVF